MSCRGLYGRETLRGRIRPAVMAQWRLKPSGAYSPLRERLHRTYRRGVQLPTPFHSSRDSTIEAHRRVNSWLFAGVGTGRDPRYAVMLMMSSAVNLSTTIFISVTLEFEPLRAPCWMSKI